MGAIGYRASSADDGGGENGSFYEPGTGGGLESAKEETTSTPSNPNRVGGERITYQTATGEITVQRATSATFGVEPSVDGVTSISAAGTPEPLSMAKPDSIIDLGPKWGDGSASVFETMGLLRRLRDGGYELAGEAAKSAALAAPAPDAPKADAPKPEAADDAISLEGVEGTSPMNDIVHKQLREAAGPATYQALISSAVLGSDMTPHIADLARTSGQPEAHVTEAVAGVFADYQRAAQQIFQANGGRSGDGLQAMLTWAQENGKQDQAIDAFQELIEGHNAAPLAKLSRAYSRLNRADWTNKELLSADYGAGVTATERDGVVYLDIKGRGEATFAYAVAHNWIRTSGGR
jgi:hypothetical protein